MAKNHTISGPNWDNSSEYKSLDDPELNQDLTMVKNDLGKLKIITESLKRSIPSNQGEAIEASQEDISLALSAAQLIKDITRILSNVSTYSSCILSVEADHEGAMKLKGSLQSLLTEFSGLVQTHKIWISYLSDQAIKNYLLDPLGSEDSFRIQRLRANKQTLLSTDEEALINILEANGPISFGNLYTDLSSTLTCSIDTPEGLKTFGMAQAATLLESNSLATRKSAYAAMNKTWSTAVIPCASTINSLAGWRLDIAQKRSHTIPQTFLSGPLFQNCLEESTLDTMFEVIHSHKDWAQKIFKQQAKILGQKQLGPWDRFAPYPSEIEHKTPFDEAIKIIKDAFGSVDSSIADFVQIMVDNKWIEGSVGPKKRPGAYCTKFSKSRTPRVYMTYTGGMKDIISLAHELGHAYHNWLLKDQPITASYYPMTLAETASIFAQTLVMDYLLEKASSDSEKQQIQWSIARDVEGFLLNIPVRFAFEKQVYTERKSAPLSHKRLNEIMNSSWRDWYGDSLSSYEELFWASKLHFHISGLSFYNFPYSFGYLFAIGVYAQRKTLGANFLDAYTALLRDTGRFTAEDIAKKYLNADLGKKDFWNDSIKQIQGKLVNF